MYICRHCENEFEEPVTRRTFYDGYNLPDGGYFESRCFCPFCLSNNFIEVKYNKLEVGENE